MGNRLISVRRTRSRAPSSNSLTGLEGNPEAQFVAEVSNPVIIVPIANTGSAGGRTAAACALRAARTARAGVRAGSAAAITATGVKVGTDGANAEGRRAGSAGLLAVAAAVGDAC